MQATKATLIFPAAVLVLCSVARGAEEKPLPVTVVYKDGEKVELKSLELGVEEKGLFGTSFTNLKMLPVKSGRLRLDVPIKNLTRIEILSVEKTGKGSEEREKVSVRLTAPGKDPLDGVIDHASRVIWKGIHPFADSEAKLDPAEIKEIILRPAGK